MEQQIEFLEEYGCWGVPDENADLDSGFSSLVVREVGCVVINMPYNEVKRFKIYQSAFIEAYVMNRVKFIKNKHKTLINISDIISVDPVVFRLNAQPRPDTSIVL